MTALNHLVPFHGALEQQLALRATPRQPLLNSLNAIVHPHTALPTLQVAAVRNPNRIPIHQRIIAVRMERAPLLGDRPLAGSSNMRRHGAASGTSVNNIPPVTAPQAAEKRALRGVGDRGARQSDVAAAARGGQRGQTGAVGWVAGVRRGAEPTWVGETLGDEGAERENNDDGGLRDGARLEVVPVEELQGREDDCVRKKLLASGERK